MEHLSEIKPNAYAVNLATFEEIELAKRKKKQTETGKKSTTATRTKKAAAPSTAVDFSAQPEPTVEPATEAQESMPPIEAVEVIQEAAPAAEAPAETQEPGVVAAASAMAEGAVEETPAVSDQEPEPPTPAAQTVAAEPPTASVEEPAQPAAEPVLTPEVGDTVVIQHTKVTYDARSRLYTIESNGEFHDASMDLDKIVRTIRALAPTAKEEELALLKLL